MKKERIAQKDVKFTCLCGNSFTAKSTSQNDEIHVEVCSKCHPFYTGQQGTATLTGKVEKFKKKYNMN